MSGSVAERASGHGSRRACLLVAIAAAGAGCPRWPPPEPRPSVRLVQLDRSAGQPAWTARFEVHNAGRVSRVVAAIDWELAVGDRPLQRGRAEPKQRLAAGERAAIQVDLAIPDEVTGELRRAADRVRLRGMVHLEDSAGPAGAAAPFDESARLF
jgi:hypothetical protein